MSTAPFDKTVLIIDDDPILIELFDEILGLYFNTQIALNISEAMTVIQNVNIDAVVSDYHLGDQNVDFLIDWIVKKRPELVPMIVVVTGESAIKFNHKDKIASVLFKPVDFNMLKQVVSDLFENHRRDHEVLE